MRKLIKKHSDGNLLEQTKDIRQRLLEYARKKKEELRNFSQEQSQKIQKNIDKSNEETPERQTVNNQTRRPNYRTLNKVRGVNRAENGEKFTK